MKKFNYGFTLVELVIVIAVLGILAGIAIPHFMEASASARGSKVLADLRTIDSACNIYAVNNGSAAKDVETLVKAGLLAAEPLADDKSFTVTTTSGKTQEYNPANFERQKYTIANGRGTYGSDSQTVEWFLNGKIATTGTMASNMEAIVAILTGQSYTIDSLNADIAGTHAADILQALKADGINLQALGAVYWKYDNDYKFLYWSSSDISGMAAGTALPVIRYNIKTGTYTVWIATVQSTTANIGQAGEHTYNTIGNLTGYTPSIGDKKENQTYDKALEHYQNALTGMAGK